MTIAAEVREITSRAEWLEWRRECITASRIAALFSAHPYLSRDALAAELRGVSQGDNASMRAGRILEPGVSVALMEEHPDWKIIRHHQFWVDPELRLGCTPDAWLQTSVSSGVLQIGTVSPEEWERLHGKPPFYKTLQTLTEAMITGSEHATLAIMVRSRSYPVYTFDVPRHPAAEARILAAVAEWWRAWDAGEIAAPAPSDGLAEALDDGTSVDLSADNEIRDLLERREASKQIVKSGEMQVAEFDAQIKSKIGAARTAWLPGWQMAYPSIHAKAYTVPERDYRRLTIKRVEE